jgi:hypothetical protein
MQYTRYYCVLGESLKQRDGHVDTALEGRHGVAVGNTKTSAVGRGIGIDDGSEEYPHDAGNGRSST